MTGWRHPIAMAAAAALLTGCTSGPDFSRPDKPTAESYTPESLAPRTSSAPTDGGSAQSFVQSMDIPGQWWALYHSPELNALIEEALRAGPDLDAAQAALRQARENFFAAQGGLFPSLSGNVGGQQQQATGFQQGLGSGTQIYGVTTASLNVSYSVDVFGGVRRQVEIAGGAGRGRALPARSDLPHPDLECGHGCDQHRVLERPDRRNPGYHSHPERSTGGRAPAVRSWWRLARRRAGPGSGARPDPGHAAAAAEAACHPAQPVDDPARPHAGPVSWRDLRSRQAEAADRAAGEPAVAARRSAARRPRRRSTASFGERQYRRRDLQPASAVQHHGAAGHGFGRSCNGLRAGHRHLVAGGQCRADLCSMAARSSTGSGPP